MDIGSETHYVRAFDWRNYEYIRKPLEYSNTEAAILTFKVYIEELAERHGKTAVIPVLDNMEVYASRQEGLLGKQEEKLTEI